MNSLFNIVSKFFNLINKLIEGISPRTARSIQQGFFFFVFVMAVIAGFIGYNMGHEAARIQSPSLIENTNDVFDIDISRQKTEGNFSELLDSTPIHEGEQKEPGHIKYQAQETMEAESDDTIIDAPKTAKRKMTPAVTAEEPVIEGEYVQKHYKKGDVKETGKDIRTMDAADEIITGEDGKGKDPQSEETIIPAGSDKSTGKKTIRRIKSKGPQPILDDAGIIKK